MVDVYHLSPLSCEDMEQAQEMRIHLAVHAAKARLSSCVTVTVMVMFSDSESLFPLKQMHRTWDAIDMN